MAARAGWLAAGLLAGALLAGEAVAQTVEVYNRPGEVACERRAGAAAVNPNGYAVIIGNSDYDRPGVPDIAYAHNDAAAICDFVVNQLGYPPEQVFVLHDQGKVGLEEWFAETSRSTSTLRRLTRALGAELELVVYYSGHGMPQDDDAFLLASDASPTRLDLGGFSVTALNEALEGLGARRVLLLLEACFSGRTVSEDGAVPLTSYAVSGAAIEAPPSSVTVLSAAGPNEVANWDPDRRLGLYTGQFIDAARGRADRDADAAVTLAELVRDLGQHVPNRSIRVVPGDTGRLQTPAHSGSLEGWTFPVTPAAEAEPLAAAEPAVEIAALPAEPPPEPPAPDAQAIEAALGLVRADWRRIQDSLAALGYDPGDVDGLPGQRTREALAAWQRAAGRDETAYLDETGHAALIDEAEPKLAALEAARVVPAPPVPVEEAVGVYERYDVGERFRDGPGLPEMVVIPAGRYMRGSTDAERAWAVEQGGKPEHFTDEGPRREVRIAEPLAVGVSEVTVGQFRRFVEATGHDAGDRCRTFEDGSWDWRDGKTWESPGFAQTDSHPVVCVNFADAQAYVRWLSRETGATYRLLSEAEWEYAARADTTGWRYWGDDRDNTAGCRYANAADQTAKAEFGWSNVMSCADEHVFTAPAGVLRENDFGLHDMLGNVWEWTQDCYVNSYDNAPTDGRLVTTGECTYQVLRGGSWSSDPRSLRSADRYRFAPGDRDIYVGFRVARMLTS